MEDEEARLRGLLLRRSVGKDSTAEASSTRREGRSLGGDEDRRSRSDMADLRSYGTKSSRVEHKLRRSRWDEGQGRLTREEIGGRREHLEADGTRQDCCSNLQEQDSSMGGAISSGISGMNEGGGVAIGVLEDQRRHKRMLGQGDHLEDAGKHEKEEEQVRSGG